MTLDLRGFLDRVRAERRTDLVEIEREVNPRYETTAILTRLEQNLKSPVLLFKNVRGSRFPVVSNVCGSMGRLALALDCPLRAVGDRYAEGCERPLPPMVRPRAGSPVAENELQGAEVDLGLLPALVYHEGDSENPYITGAIVVARDPDTGKSNLSYHRMMIAGRDRSGIFMEHGKHLEGIYRKYVRLGRPMPIGVFMGIHPLVSLGALYSGAADVEEYDIVGGLMRAPLPLVECLTQPGLFIPADAEMALEGQVSVRETLDEGPFGEFTGYGTGKIRTPVFEASAMTFRHGCLFQDVVSGHMEHLILPVPAIERRIRVDARAAAPGVTRVALTAPFTVLVAVEKRDDAEPLAIIEALLEDVYVKHVIVVDASVEISDPRQVLTAMGLHTQAGTGVHVFPDRQGTPLDPSCPSSDGRVSKMGIDATRRLVTNRHVTKNTIPQAVLDAVDMAELSNVKVAGAKGGSLHPAAMDATVHSPAPAKGSKE
jgi:UbiD family decarboxylase